MPLDHDYDDGSDHYHFAVIQAALAEPRQNLLCNSLNPVVTRNEVEKKSNIFCLSLKIYIRIFNNTPLSEGLDYIFVIPMLYLEM